MSRDTTAQHARHAWLQEDDLDRDLSEHVEHLGHGAEVPVLVRRVYEDDGVEVAAVLLPDATTEHVLAGLLREVAGTQAEVRTALESAEAFIETVTRWNGTHVDEKTDAAGPDPPRASGGRVVTAREINARFSTVCKQCGGHIPKGTRVLWAAAEGVRHLPGECVADGTEQQQHAPPGMEVPAGRYAVENGGGELRFYRVWRGTRNPSVVRVYVLHGPDEDRVPGRLAELGVLAKIAGAGPREAAIRYGREIGECSSCGLRLTNALSRELGIGPVCGGRFYADKAAWTAVKKEARTELRKRGIDPAAELPDDAPTPAQEYGRLAQGLTEREQAQVAREEADLGPDLGGHPGKMGALERPRPGGRTAPATEAERDEQYGDVPF